MSFLVVVPSVSSIYCPWWFYHPFPAHTIQYKPIIHLLISYLHLRIYMYMYMYVSLKVFLGSEELHVFHGLYLVSYG